VSKTLECETAGYLYFSSNREAEGGGFYNSSVSVPAWPSMPFSASSRTETISLVFEISSWVDSESSRST